MIELRDRDKSAFAKLLNLLPDSVIASDAEGTIVFANDLTLQLFGYSHAELAGKKVEFLLPERFRKAHHEHRENYFAAPRTRPMGIGLNLVGRKKDGSEFPVDISLSPVFAQDGVVVLAAIRDHTRQKSAERELSERAAQQAAVAELVMQAISDVDLSKLFKAVTTRIARTLGVEFSAVLEFRPEIGSLRLQEGAGWNKDFAGEMITSSPEFVSGYTLLSRKVIVTADFAQEVRFSRDPLLERSGVASCISAIIGEGASPWGVLGVYSDRKHGFSVDHTHFVQTVASVLAGTIQRQAAEEENRRSRTQLHALALRLQAVREEEQKRIAREIHDELGQSLTVLKFDLAYMARHFAELIDRDERGAFNERLSSMEQSISNAIRQTQSIASSLRPSVLDDLGLAAAVEWQAGEFQSRTGIQTEVSLAAHPVFSDPRRGTEIFRIMQEALTNVARHARATQVRISLEENDGHLCLTVKDNGKGVEDSDLTRPDALGLLGMRERADSVGADLAIEGRPGEGTVVRLRIPIDA